MEGKRNIYRDFVGKYEGKRLFLRPSRRGKGNINTDLKEIGRKWTGLIWLRIWTGGRLL
jgi:hypothetical protein